MLQESVLGLFCICVWPNKVVRYGTRFSLTKADSLADLIGALSGQSEVEVVVGIEKRQLSLRRRPSLAH